MNTPSVVLSLCDILFIRGASPGRSPARKSDDQSKRHTLLASSVQKSSPPATSKPSQGFSKSPSPNGIPKRIKKGRGFTERYAFARRYRTPSPERSPHIYRYGDRNIRRNFDRYVQTILLNWII